ncbi:hypothetical protein ACIHEI_06500, partial [Kitasatospora sp. NPDC051984]|uniref:hypothetical protein n=1 Tax=Kitasatospora sp. NPDC051984 TaxID=3364059 RepID=UPI0037C629BC
HSSTAGHPDQRGRIGTTRSGDDRSDITSHTVLSVLVSFIPVRRGSITPEWLTPLQARTVANAFERRRGELESVASARQGKRKAPTGFRSGPSLCSGREPEWWPEAFSGIIRSFV